MPQGVVRMRRFAVRGGLLLVALLALVLYVYPAAAAQLHFNSGLQSRVSTFRAQTLLQRIQSHQLASTVQVLDSQAPSVIIQFPLFPSGVKRLFHRPRVW